MRHPNPEIRLAERALREGWDTPADKRAELVKMLVELALDPKQKTRQRITAVKTLILAETLSLKGIEVTIKATEHETLKDRVEALEEDQGLPRRIIVPNVDDRWESGPPARAQPPQED
jgi:hypothetical protein